MDEILGLDRGALDRARLSRDPRFDGKFFIAVTSTGIYCRPVCPSPPSKVSNVRYYATAAAAAEAGFRPCLRCRPEAAPGTPAWLGTSAAVRRALRLIQEGVLDEISVDDLALRIGIGPRHLHRLFIQHVGASPIAVAQTRRLHFAKRLLDDTDLPITQIALASGFGSLRRFNHTFQRTYQRAPRELRKDRRGGRVAQGGGEVVLKLAFRPPYDWPQVHDFLAQRAVPGVERVDARGYARTVLADGGHALVCVRALDGENALELRVRGAAPAALFQLSTAARRTFDLAADPARIAVSFKSDPLLAPLVRSRPGLRIPGAWDPFECAACAVLSQQLGMDAARRQLSRLVTIAGQPIAAATDGLTHLFPTPAAIANLDLDQVGIPAARIAAVRSIARAVLDQHLDFGASVEEITATLAALEGCGGSIANYVALRSLGEPDAFPAADLQLRRAAADDAAPLTAHTLGTRAEAWRPWRGYAAVLLWQSKNDQPTLWRARPPRAWSRPKAAGTRAATRVALSIGWRSPSMGGLMKTPALIALSIGAPLALAAAEPAQDGIQAQRTHRADVSSSETGLRVVHEARAQALARSERGLLSKLVDEDFRYTSARGDWLDRNAFLALDGQSQPGYSTTHDEVRVRIFGDVGLVHGLLTQRAARGIVRMQRYTDVYRHDGTTWKLVAAQLSDIVDPQQRTLQTAIPPRHEPWPGSEPSGDDEQVLRELNAGYVQAFLDSNVAWYDAHLAPDYLVVFSDGSLHDKGSMLAAAAHPVTNMKSFPTTRVAIRRFGEVALIHAENAYERTDGLKGVNRYTDIWHKSEGRWICIAAHVTRHKLPS